MLEQVNEAKGKTKARIFAGIDNEGESMQTSLQELSEQQILLLADDNNTCGSKAFEYIKIKAGIIYFGAVAATGIAFMVC